MFYVIPEKHYPEKRDTDFSRDALRRPRTLFYTEVTKHQRKRRQVRKKRVTYVSLLRAATLPIKGCIFMVLI